MFFNRKYKLKHNFGKNKTVVQEFMKKLALNSKDLFDKQAQNGQVLDLRKEHASLLEFLSDVEEYLNYCQHDSNFADIFNSISRLNAISVLPPNMRGVYGYTEKNTIYINPNLSGNRDLNPQERTKLYVAHELGHLINRNWLQSASNHLNSQLQAKKITLPQGQLALDGFSLLDEVTAQNRAEDFAYFTARKIRPGYRTFSNPNIFSGKSYTSNFDYYCELQSPAVAFARTLSGIESNYNDATTLNKLSNRALNPNFATNIFNEFNADGQESNLHLLLQYMGTLKHASYALFGMGDTTYLANSARNLNNFYQLANILKINRSPVNQK